jgi:preprotein translocase subunit SecY
MLHCYADYLCSGYYVYTCCCGLSKSDTSQSIVGFSNMFGFGIICFCINRCIYIFYTAITVPTNKMSDDLKRSGGFIPGVRGG